MQTLAISIEINLHSEEIAQSVNYLSYLIRIRTCKPMNMYIQHIHMCTPTHTKTYTLLHITHIDIYHSHPYTQSILGTLKYTMFFYI